MGYRLLIQKNNPFSFNRAYLLSIPILSLLLPLIVIPKTSLPIDTSLIYGILLPEINIENTLSPAWSVQKWLLIIYILGIAIGFSRIVFSFIQINRIQSKSNYNGQFFEVADTTEAFSFLNKIYIGSLLTQQDQHIAYQHELVHINKHHSIDLIFSRLFLLFCWFNPFAYKLPLLLKEQHEYEADHISCNDPERYIKLLLKQKFQTSSLPFGHHFNANTNLKSRIMRIQEQTKPSLSIKAIGALSVFIAISFLGIQTLQATTPPSINSVESSSIITESDSVYMVVDQMPEYPGGQEAMMQFIAENTIYPAEAKKDKIKGRVFISFVVGLEGQVENVTVIKGAHPLLDQAGLDVINKLPNFDKPGMQDGKVVKVQYNMPINFSL
jgi:TonB family protein